VIVSPARVEIAQPAHLPDIAALAAVVWRAHYPGIISPEQIAYMLGRMYDIEVMRREMLSGINYLRALVEEQMRGLASSGPASATEHKLHKLYVHPQWQGRGLGAALIERAEQHARANGASSLVLNVNKRNEEAIAAYRKRGFTVRDSVVVDIGGGFVMDDFVMVKPL